jgi:hypothetical protein
MESYFTVELCRGPFSDTSEESIRSSIQYIFQDIDADFIGKFWEDFSFAEELLERAAAEVGEDSTVAQDDRWILACKNLIAEEVFCAAKKVYLESSNDATQRIIGGDSWIISGGMTWEGESTQSAEYIKLVRWSGLDEHLYLLGRK